MCAIKPNKPLAENSRGNVSGNAARSTSPPHTVMIRLYGKIIQENPETVVTDSVIFALLAERGMGPKLYGVFTEGRVEEYVPVSVHCQLVVNDMGQVKGRSYSQKCQDFLGCNY